MPNYQNGKVYKLTHPDIELPYIGSTTQSLAVRKGGHKARWIHARENKTTNNVTSFQLFDAGWKDVVITLLEKCPCCDKEELLHCERGWIECTPCLNKTRPIVTKEEMKIYYQEYAQANAEKISKYKKEYAQAHKEEIGKWMKEYAQANAEKLSEYHKQYREANAEKLSTQKKMKVTCEVCDCEVQRNNLSRHKKSQKHLRNLTKHNTDIE